VPTPTTTPIGQQSQRPRHRYISHPSTALSAQRSLVIALLGLTLALGLASCSYAPQSDPLAAVSVNGHTISLSLYQQLSTYDTAFSAFQGQPQNWRTPAQRSSLSNSQRQLMQFIVNAELLREQMQAQHLTISKKNQQAAATAVNQAVAHDKTLMKQSPTDATIRAVVAAETPDVVAYLITYQAMLATFEQQGKVPAVSVQVILVSAQSDAQELLGQVKHGADFATLARQHSLDTATAVNGGAIKPPFYVGGLNADFDKAAFGPHPQQYIIVPVSSDYALFKLGQRSIQPLSGVTDSTGQTQQQYINNWLTDVVLPQAQVHQYVTL